MILAPLALALSAAFAGAALYINWSEQPARLALDDRSLLRAWKPSYAKGFEMQATLALVGGLTGLAAFVFERSLLAGIGGVLMLANWPYTLIAIMPTNRRLGGTPEDQASADTRALIRQWGRLHAVRTGLGLAAAACLLAALILSR